MKYTDILVRSSVQNVQNLVQQVFYQNGFKVNWQSGLVGKATKGDQGTNVLLGGFAQYFEIDFQIWPMENQTVAVRIMKSNIGVMGGLWGAHQVETKYKEIVDMLSNYFYSQGVYVGRNPP
jgi:hypothetical protein